MTTASPSPPFPSPPQADLFPNQFGDVQNEFGSREIESDFRAEIDQSGDVPDAQNQFGNVLNPFGSVANPFANALNPFGDASNQFGGDYFQADDPFSGVSMFLINASAPTDATMFGGNDTFGDGDGGDGNGSLASPAPTEPPYCGKDLMEFSKAYDSVHGYVSVGVCLFGCVVNILNVIVLTRKSMVSPTNAILTGLAVADFLVLLEYMPFAFHMYILRGRPMRERYTYPWALFVLFHAHFAQVFHTISIWLTVTLAVWRYVAVAWPNRNMDWCNMDRARYAIVAAYVGSPVLSVPSFLSFSIQSIPYSEKISAAVASASAADGFAANTTCDNGNCTRNMTLYLLGHSELSSANDSLLKNSNFWIYSVLIKILPCFALTILSQRLIVALLAAQRRKRALTSRMPVAPSAAAAAAAAAANSNSTTTPTGGSTSISNNHHSHAKKHEKPEKQDKHSRASEAERQTNRTTQMLLAVLLLFLVTEFPQGIMGLLSGILGDNFFRTCYNAVGSMMDLFALVNSGVNFFLYYSMSRQFKETFELIFVPKTTLRKWIPVPQNDPQTLTTNV